MINIKSLMQVVVVALSLMLLVFVSAFLTLKVVTWGETVAVPQLVGLDLSDAVNLLKEQRLEASVDGHEHHPDVPENSVIYQSPPADSNVKMGRGISLVVSLGSEEVTVPYVVGEVFNRAHILLTKAGLTVGDVSRVSAARARDGVMAQVPPEGTVLQKDAKLDLLVSEGMPAARFVTPMLVGLKISEAEGLTAGMAVRLITGGRGPAIVSQSPQPGYALLAGSALHVTLGQPEFKPPELIRH